MDWLRKNVILSIIGGIVTASVFLGGLFTQRMVNQMDAKPSKPDVLLMIKAELKPILKENNKHNERLIKLENSVMAIGSINTKLDGIVKKQGEMSIDIAVIKTRIDQ